MLTGSVSRLAGISKALRIRKGYSQGEIAIAYGYSQPYISMLECGAFDAKDIRAYLVFLAALSFNDERSAGNSRVTRKGDPNVLRRKGSAKYQVLTERSEIAQARKALRKVIAAETSQRGTMPLGHQGQTWDGKAYYLASLNIWTVFDDGRNETELWNTYGIGNPFDGGSRSMICHLSVPTENINRRIGAVYARAVEMGDVYILHRGKIGGGRKGVGKSAFFERYDGKIVAASDGERTTDFAVVGAIEATTFLRGLQRFVLAVKEIKAEATR